ncbi:hypothetical protein AwErysi_09870 [Erysipelotrichaceae bacterium]|nr:hypothetical protein AwErysi_09870 [Erysipelotrichaceae bacterium]
MKIIKPSKEMKTVETIFEIAAQENKKVTIGKATVLPGQRLPEIGTTTHTADEYSYIIKGDIYTASGGSNGVVLEGSSTFIPKGEEHWCRNDGTEAVEIIWVFVE